MTWVARLKGHAHPPMSSTTSPGRIIDNTRSTLASYIFLGPVVIRTDGKDVVEVPSRPAFAGPMFPSSVRTDARTRIFARSRDHGRTANPILATAQSGRPPRS